MTTSDLKEGKLARNGKFQQREQEHPFDHIIQDEPGLGLWTRGKLQPGGCPPADFGKPNSRSAVAVDNTTKLDDKLFMNGNTLAKLSDSDFIKSSRCTYPPGGCVEVAMKGDTVAVRDAKNRTQTLLFTKAEWETFVQGVKAGEFDVR